MTRTTALGAISRAALFSSLSLLAALSGCNSGSVQVTAQIPTQAPGPAISGQGAGSQSPASPDGGTAGSANGGTGSDSIYFERVLLNSVAAGLGAGPGQILESNGIAFLSSESTVQQPFAFEIPTSRFDGQAVRIAPTRSGAIYATPSGLEPGADDLIAMDEESLRGTKIAEVPNGVTWVAAAGDIQGKFKAAWIDGRGNAFYLSASGTTPRALDLGGVSARRAEFVSSRHEIWVETSAAPGASGAAQTLRFDDQTGSRLGVLSGASASASPEGARAALVVPGANSTLALSVEAIVPTTTSATRTLALALTSASDFTWISATELVYRGQAQGGSQELHLVDLATGTESKIVSLESTLTSEGVACPLWHEGKLYFADSNGSQYVIYQVDPAAGGAPEVFAAPMDAEEGLICPVAAAGGSHE